jgi:alpha-tubulin suppressor-like RCC1 family protein
VPDSGCGDLTSSNENCGACGNVCEAGACFESVCGGQRVTAVATGYDTSCALFASGHVSCWGRGNQGELGVDPATLGTCPDGPHCRSAAAEISGITTATQISVGKRTVCALLKGGDVSCWGSNQAGVLAHAPGTAGDSVCDGQACNWVPSKVAGITSPVLEVRVGQNNACARTADDHIWCWGDDGWFNDGQGNTTEHDLSVATIVPNTPSAITSLSVAPNAPHVCVMSNSGVTCWGGNLNGELGHAPDAGTPQDIAAPEATSYEANSTPETFATPGLFPNEVNASQGSTCFLDTSHTMHCLGQNYNGELGNGTTPDGNSHPAYDTISVTGNVTAIAAGTPMCALTASGAAWCWGSAAIGQIGNGAWSGVDAGAFPGILTQSCLYPPCYATPVEVPAMSFTSLAASTDHVIGVATDGHVYGWGKNEEAETGHDPNTLGDQTCSRPGLTCACAPSPVRIPSLP